MPGEECKPKVVYYKPSGLEESFALIVAVLAGFTWLSAVSRSGDLQSAMQALVGIVMYGLLGYLVVVLLREVLVAPIVSSIARLRVQQVQGIVREVCGWEISEAEALEALQKVTGKHGKRGGGKGQEHKHPENSNEHV